MRLSSAARRSRCCSRRVTPRTRSSITAASIRASSCWPSPTASRIWRAWSGGPATQRKRRLSAFALLAASFVVHDTDEIGRVLGPELGHDAGPVHLDGARADPELAAGLLAGSAGHDLGQHILLAAGQRLATRE